ncbi:CmpA/NrtA family ABC transporter substrate-binding protein [Sphingomonas sp. LaA6.9]|uniref:CmpA/NrtA family ABC transporter substrate-binding protein n=1 Tax=Sphingomonas sp. LaA6.9 TaxID=2919914 RepID=UPI001F4FCAC4|nr:CmpA/NrtA family ABC transporter substrate-binding protein [Sphingomonas sp. LaA6.9]MCJ8156323.1 ABC transporter substrate-binding protein [Sphingomonas sp. LaA6.9]
MSVFRIGFLPLVDSVLPIVAHEFGLANAEGIAIELVRDPSWATVRDRLIYGQTDAAHLLAPLAIATSLGLDRPAVPLGAPFMLGLNGNAVTVSRRIAALIGNMGIDDVAATGRALAGVARKESAAGRKLRFAVVHRYSSHNYMLRYWLSASGCDPDTDVEIVVVPPPFVADALASGEIDGSCVGEPWNSVAVERGVGVIIAATARIWSRGVEKLLAFRRQTLDERGEEVAALIRALHAAGKAVSDPVQRKGVAELLARHAYIDQPAALIEHALCNQMVLAAGQAPTPIADFLVLHREAANFPWRSQAMWLYSQMVRWGHATLDSKGFEAAAAVFRPDIYRAALAGTDAILPGASAKVEGAIEQPMGAPSVSGRLILGPDRFFDGRRFDPDRAEEYLAQG